MISSVPTIPRHPRFSDILSTLAFAVLLSFLIDSALISAGFAFASNFVQDLSASAGVAGVFFMVLSLLVIWPVVLIPLVIVLLTDAVIRRMPMWLFVVSFSVIVTAAFAVFLYVAFWHSQWGLASFLQNIIVLVDTGIAWLVSSTFAILYKTFSGRRRP